MKPLRVLSLGAGVQSTTMALMASFGKIEPPDCAIFADTGWEPKEVYEHLERLMIALPYPVYIVQHGNIREDILLGKQGRRFASIPFFMRNPDGSEGLGRRQCTGEYKLKPLYKKCKELLGVDRPKPGAVEMLIGISTDEAHRMKPSRLKYVVNKYPLIDLRMNRNDCKRWMRDNGWTAPKSSCIGCPFHSNAMWRDMKLNKPEEWADAVEIDKEIRQMGSIKGAQYMHRSLVPLDEVDLSSAEDRGQTDMFGNECEGMCGV